MGVGTQMDLEWTGGKPGGMMERVLRLKCWDDTIEKFAKTHQTDQFKKFLALFGKSILEVCLEISNF